MTLRPGMRFLLITLFLVVLITSLAVGIRASLGDVILGADLYTRWVGGRAFLDGRNPYSPAVTLESQLGIYGRPAQPDEDQVAFAYPPHSLIWLLPIVWLDFPWAQAVWLALQLVLLAIVLNACSSNAPILFRFLPFFTYPIALGLILGNFSLTIGVILLLGFNFFTKRGNLSPITQYSLGFSLALATIKPQLVWLSLFFLLALAFRRRYHRVWISFFASLAALGLAFLIFIPNWPADWTNQVFAYTAYDLGDPVIYTMLSIPLPSSLAVFASIFLGIILIGLTILFFLRWWHGKMIGLFLFSWCGWLTYLLHPNGMAYEQISFYVPMFLWVMQPEVYRTKGIIWGWGLWLLLGWLAFLIGRWVFPPADVMPVLFFGGWLAWFVRNPGRLEMGMGKPSSGLPG